MDINALHSRYQSGTIDPELYNKLLQMKQEFDKQRNAIRTIWDRSQKERWAKLRAEGEVGKIIEPLLDRYLPELEKVIGNRGIADTIAHQWMVDTVSIPEKGVVVFPALTEKYYYRMGQWLHNYTQQIGLDTDKKIREIAKLSLQPVNFSANQGLQQQVADLQRQLAELQKTRSAPQPEATIQPTQTVGEQWELPEEGLLQTGEFATQLAKQRQQQDANLMASGLTRQQILQQRGSENIVRELGLSKMIAEQRRKSIQDWLQTAGGLQQQTRPPDFTGLREMASAFQQGTSAQQQMMMKVFENLMRQGGS